MARPSNTGERREQIAGGLLKVMARKGYEGASVAEIAAAAKLTAGLVHYHFGSKQEILLHALGSLVHKHQAWLDQRLALAGGDPAAEVSAFIDVHLGLGADADPEALAVWVILSGEALRQSEVRSAYRKALTSWTKQLAAIIRRGVEAKVFSAEPEEAAAAIMATIQGYFVVAATARSLIPRGSAGRSTKAMVMGLLHARALPTVEVPS